MDIVAIFLHVYYIGFVVIVDLFFINIVANLVKIVVIYFLQVKFACVSLLFVIVVLCRKYCSFCGIFGPFLPRSYCGICGLYGTLVHNYCDSRSKCSFSVFFCLILSVLPFLFVFYSLVAVFILVFSIV